MPEVGWVATTCARTALTHNRPYVVRFLKLSLSFFLLHTYSDTQGIFEAAQGPVGLHFIATESAHHTTTGRHSCTAAATTARSMMATPEESLPLRVSLDSNAGPESNADHRGKKFALGVTAAYLVQVTVVCLPAVVRVWHPTFYATLEHEEQRGWTWLGANSLWLALALFWTLLHLDNGPCVATACLLCSLLWAYLLVVLLCQAGRGQLPFWAIANLVVYVVMLGVCLRTAWVGVAKKSHKARSDGSATWRRVLRKWALVSASLLLLVSVVLWDSSFWNGEVKRQHFRTAKLCC